ncbi:serine/threonine-protein kinase [Mycoplasma tauri]|uniref:Serine/threonine protein kinase n=1 Tax=Mycoplasma tauri TaxID=547987 RepID=A0A953T3N4_9MOLU|nr:serine/threonine-protein kinase [Mycoplasma tauri]MBZ4195268.1 serine/threonine protein kinase [Mycoplasma tauri]MBZ4203905.1 serine/threonine protein kinase [Mycoplasma tauri]MBZ4204169.1 serine/threonine protein kinase [Mycoplasma tauri]MBZ4212567.1 serine/threonine protein kinase [Mycoplasma tauri]MBZ4218199.1 serine/threonine protein kinase [Mycoplasma tauri]
MAIKSNSKVFENYKVLSKIGDGGFSEVYKVESLESKSPVKVFYALKYFIVKNGADPESTLKRFKQEIEIMKKVRSEFFPYYVDSYIDDVEQFVVMEYVEGHNLRERIKSNGRLLPITAVEYVKQICSAIQELHSCDIIHRDIKSNNIIITTNNNIKILDFGLSLDPDSQRYTQEQKVIGSVYYMAPELCIAKSLPSSKSDIYAIGILLYELLTGDYPIKGAKPLETLKLQSNAQVPKLTSIINAPQALENVIIKATAKEPNQRYASSWEMYNDLKTVFSEKRIYEKPLDAKKIKPKRTFSEIINSKGFLIAMLSIFAAVILVIVITIIALLFNK